MKKCLILLFLVVLLVFFDSCHDDDRILTPPVVNIESITGTFSVAQEDTLVLKACVESSLETTLTWMINGESVSTDSVYAFIPTELGNYTITLTAVNEDGETAVQSLVEVYGKYKYGTFVLNEGGYSTGGSLVFISPKGVVTDTVYRKENNGNRLGSYSQDLFIYNNKMYIVSQNGGNEGGFLTVLNAETLKQENAYQSELNGKVSWPTHVAVLSDTEVYLRCNYGITCFNPLTKETKYINGSESSRKNTMVVANGKIFAAKNKTMLVIESGKDTISHAVEFEGNVSGILKSSDGNLWVSTADGKISKVNPTTYSIIKTNTLPEEAAKLLTASFAATPSITAKGDTLYMSALATKIYRHIFSTNQTDFMLDTKELVTETLVYNTAAVHPVTGHLYMNILKSYSNSPKNHIAVFDFEESVPRLHSDYMGYTICPAGIFFTYNFE